VPELLYLSRAKLQRWPSRRSGSGGLPSRIGGEIGGGPLPGKVTLASTGAQPDQDSQIARDYRKLRSVLKELESSDRFSRWVTDPLAGPGQWVEFEGPMRYGRIGRDHPRTDHEASGNIVFFIGSFGESSPVVDVMLGGWVGHLLDESARDTSLRMGSRTDHLYDLWNELAEAEHAGDFAIPGVWGRLQREISRGDHLTLDVICRWAYGMAENYLPRITALPLKGHAQVLARLPADEYQRPLLVGTPLYVEYSAAPLV
jgi:hypothetical protein